MKPMKLLMKVDAKPTEEYSTAQKDAEIRYDEGEGELIQLCQIIQIYLTKIKKDYLMI
jgi:hypothetical protein